MSLIKENAPKLKVKTQAPPEKVFLKRDLVIRLQHLRSVTREVAGAYLSNLEHQILEVIDHLNAAGNNGKTFKLKTGSVKSMVKSLDKLTLKPEKGRRKDLKRIERTIESISGALIKKKS